MKIRYILSMIFWETFQTIFALVLLLILIKIKKWYRLYQKKIIIIELENKSWLYGVSLGRFIFIRSDCMELKHEIGHTFQSLYLGWLYLIIIGIPSFLRCKIFQCKSLSQYYSGFPENWSDKLGQIKRDKFANIIN